MDRACLCSFAAALTLVACGSRSQLREGNPSSDGGGGAGAGGTGTTGGTTTVGGGGTGPTVGGGGTGPTVGGGGTGGTGGLLGTCADLEVKTPFASLQGGTMSHQRAPKLSYSSESDNVTIASAWQVVEGPGPNPPIELRHTTLTPWIAFPTGAGLGPTYLADLDAGVSFAIAPSLGDKFALIFRDFQQPPSGGLRFSSEFVGFSGDVPSSTLVDDDARDVLFLTRRPGDRYLFGAAAKQGDNYEIRAGIISGGSLATELTMGCANGVPLAAGFSTFSSLFMAYLTGTDAMGCDNPGPPNRLRIARFDGASLTGVTELDNLGISDLDMVARSDGAWLVYGTKAQQDLTPEIRILRIDQNGEPVAGVGPLLAPFQPGSISIASSSDYLAIGWIQAEPEGAVPVVQIFDPDGDQRARVTVPATGKAQGRVSLLGSPDDNRRFALAWSETASAGDQIRITRLDCIDVIP